MKYLILTLVFLTACGRAEFGSATAADDVVAPTQNSGASEEDGNESDRLDNSTNNFENVNNDDSGNNDFNPADRQRSVGVGVDFRSTFREIAEREDNFVFAPHGLDKTLLSLHAASSGETERELAEAMKISDPSVAYELFAERSTKIDSALDAQFAEVGVWIDTSFPIEQNFVDALALYFDVQVRRVNLRESETARVQINNTLRSETNGFASETLPPSGLEMGDFVVAGATYYNSPWQNEFKRIPELEFHGETESVTQSFITSEGAFLSMQDNALQSVTIPLESGHALVLVMPVDGTLDSVLGEFDAPFLQRLVDESQVNELSVTLPMIDVGTHLHLAEYAEFFGFETLQNGEATFAQSGLEDANLGAAVQFSRMAWTDNGIEDTTTDPSVNSSEIRFDQPFLFAVLDAEDRSILYAGQVSQPYE